MRSDRTTLVSALMAAVAAITGAQEVSLPAPLLVLPDRHVIVPADATEALLTPAPTPEEQVAELVNLERLNCPDAGCPKPPLKHQANLILAGEEHSQSMALNDYFSHLDFAQSCIGVGTRMTNAGYTGWTAGAENIAAGSATAAAAMAQWMGSSGHRTNILSSSYRELGVGYYQQVGDQANIELDGNTNCQCSDEPPTGVTQCPSACAFCALQHYWTQVFGARGGTTGYPVIIEREKHSIGTAIVDLYLYQPPGTSPQMRFANETGGFTTFEPYQANALNWILTAGDGRKTVIAEVTTSSGTFRTCDRIWLDGSGDSSFVFADGFECEGTASWSALGS